VQEGGAGKPGQQRGVLDGVPSPVSAPAQLHVRPLASQHDSHAEEEPRGERPAPGHPDPVAAQLPRQQGGHTEGKRNDKPDVPQVEQRRVDDHGRVLEQGIEALPVTRSPRAGDAVRVDGDQLLERIRREVVEVQEEERRRLARELHDDLNQRLAIMAIDTGRLEEQLKCVPGLFATNVKEIKERVIKLSADVHDISRQLHPSIIEDLGLKQAIESECLNFTKRSGIVIKYEPKDIPLKIPWDISVCLFRVVQEGLRNIARHALVQKAEVSLLGGNGNITLTIEDCGVGFETAKTGKQSGLGFISMEERVRLIRGDFLVKSKPGKGTIIKVVIPLLGN